MVDIEPPLEDVAFVHTQMLKYISAMVVNTCIMIQNHANTFPADEAADWTLVFLSM